MVYYQPRFLPENHFSNPKTSLCAHETPSPAPLGPQTALLDLSGSDHVCAGPQGSCSSDGAPGRTLHGSGVSLGLKQAALSAARPVLWGFVAH